MVIVNLTGGLGNQMFQYAAGRRLALANDVPLKLDVGWFQEKGPWTPRKYELSVFPLHCETGSFHSFNDFNGRFQNPALRKFISKLGIQRFFSKYEHVVETAFHFDREILHLKPDVCLEGYWQSYKYFDDIEDIIRRDFEFDPELTDKNREIANLISSSESVSIHIRRGDYVSSESISEFHGLCQLSYYREAVKRFTERLKEPTFFVFSDDMAWARENLKFCERVHFVSHNCPEAAHLDMQLMSMCKNHIIANSSFSWWGAWLNPCASKIVIAPQRWFNDPKINTSDLYLLNWERI